MKRVLTVLLLAAALLCSCSNTKKSADADDKEMPPEFEHCVGYGEYGNHFYQMGFSTDTEFTDEQKYDVLLQAVAPELFSISIERDHIEECKGSHDYMSERVNAYFYDQRVSNKECVWLKYDISYCKKCRKLCSWRLIGKPKPIEKSWWG